MQADILTRLIIISFVLLVSCRQTIKFNKDSWQKKSDLGLYPEREQMLFDLTTNYKLIGLHYNDLIKLLGQPDFWEQENKSIFYGLATKYNADIDPTGLRSIQFNFTSDSVISDFKIIDTGP